MSDSAVGILMFIGICLICALLCHTFIRNYFIATLVAGPAASLAFQIAATIQLGYMDPFAPIAFVICTFIAWGYALAVGLPFLLIRLNRRSKGSKSQAGEDQIGA